METHSVRDAYGSLSERLQFRIRPVLLRQPTFVETLVELWLRHRKAAAVAYDARIQVSSQAEWHKVIYDPRVISSILWPDVNRFPIVSNHVNRRHPHETDYRDNPARNLSYLSGCRKIAEALDRVCSGARCLVYAPLRGALPIWRGIRQFIPHMEIQVYYPVTSSFVFFPEEFGIVAKRGKAASGRYNNRFELERIQPFFDEYDYFIYVDEIVSGGMMRGHLRDMFRMGVDAQIPIVAVGLADAFGARSQANRLSFEQYVKTGKLACFIWEGCESLITEDQKFLLGTHYVDYHLGPHVVPLFDERLVFYPEKEIFDREVYTHYLETQRTPDPFCAQLINQSDCLGNHNTLHPS